MPNTQAKIKYAGDSRSDLTKLNQERWAKVGQLKRTKALIGSLCIQYNSIDRAGNAHNLMDDIEAEIVSISNWYDVLREDILRRREEAKKAKEIR